MPPLKSKSRQRRMAYDVDRKCTKPLSRLEIALSDKIFGQIENILSKDGYDIRGKYVSYGNCECNHHRQTQFIIELNTKEISVEVIHEIEDALEVLKDVEFADIIARHEGRKTFLVLVFVQEIDKQIASS
jgi:hypothetical protein